MQTIPEPGLDGEKKGDGGECRIGGTSVGCGNPIKNVAFNPIDLCLDGNNSCLAGAISLTVRFHLHNDSIGLQILRPKGLGHFTDTQFIISKAETFLRFDGQVYPLDSIPLGTFGFDSNLSRGMAYRDFCDSIDNPDHVCSERKMGSIEISLLTKVTITVQNVDYLFIGVHQGIELNTQAKSLRYQGKSALIDTQYLQSTFNLVTAHLDSTFTASTSAPGAWILYVPGTEAYAIQCSDSTVAVFDKLIPKKNEVRGLFLDPNSTSNWMPIYQVDSIAANSMENHSEQTLTLLDKADSTWLPTSTIRSVVSSVCH